MRQYAYVGLDLGQSQDYTALCIVEEQLFFRGDADYTEYNILIPDKEAEAPCYVSPLELPPITAEKLLFANFLSTPPSQRRVHIRHLERYDLGTRYTAIVGRVEKLLRGFGRHWFNGRVQLVLDKTGVGAGVLDMFYTRGMAPTAITIHGGEKVSANHARKEYRVPKRDLVAAVQTLMQAGQLHLAEDLPLTPTFRRELENFRVRIDPQTAHDSYSHWREGDHDDLVLAAAVALWWRKYLMHWQWQEIAG